MPAPHRASTDGGAYATSSPAATASSIRYVVVVHGMGEARKNETVISVINRFAEARRGQELREAYDVLTLGTACSHAGRFPSGGASDADDDLLCPWLEFRGIPRESGVPVTAPFLGDADKTGEQLRFVDCHWSDLTEAAYEVAGQAPERWAAGLLGRLERKDAEAVLKKSAQKRVPGWARHILRLIEDLLVLLHRLFAWRARTIDDTIFVRYLGDVQVYGEYSPLRGRAVRRFHRLLWRIEQRHEREENHAEAVALERQEPYARREARYTIIAHSLGSVMALDALLLAHASVDSKLATSPTAVGPATTTLPYPGFVDGNLSPSEDPVESVSRQVWQVAGQSPPAEATPWEIELELRAIDRREEQSTGALWEGAAEKLRRLAAIRFSPAGSRQLEEVERLRREILFKEYGYLDSGWVDRVDSFVTLGSPIDKFLVLWWLIYRFLRSPEDWLDPMLRKRREQIRIRHFNYVDEQDPVGHRLDVARSAPAIRLLFDSEIAGEDLVYNRFAVPGLAHVSYWKDLALFSRILRHAVDGEELPKRPPQKRFGEHVMETILRRGGSGAPHPERESFRLHDARIYQRILAITYWYVPALLAGAMTAMLWWAYRAESLATSAGAALALLGIGLLGRRVVDLLVWWRGLLRHKGRASPVEAQIRRLARFRWWFLLAALVITAWAVSATDWRPLVVALGLLLAALFWRILWVSVINVLRSTGWNPRVEGSLGVWDVSTRQFQSLVSRQNLAILHLVFLILVSMLVGWYASSWGVRASVAWPLARIAIVLVVGTLVWWLVRARVLRPVDHRTEKGAERAPLVLLGLISQVAAASWIGAALVERMASAKRVGRVQETLAAVGLDTMVQNPWLVKRGPDFVLLAAAAAAAAAVAFGYVRYRRWQVEYRLTDEPIGRTAGIHLLLFLPAPFVRWLGGRGERSPAHDTVDFEAYADD